MSRLNLSRHARARASQRGVPHHLIHALIAHADLDTPAGGNCRCLRCSRERLADRGLRAELGADLDRLASLAIIWSDHDGGIVTILHQSRRRRLH